MDIIHKHPETPERDKTYIVQAYKKEIFMKKAIESIFSKIIEENSLNPGGQSPTICKRHIRYRTGRSRKETSCIIIVKALTQHCTLKRNRTLKTVEKSSRRPRQAQQNHSRLFDMIHESKSLN